MVGLLPRVAHRRTARPATLTFRSSIESGFGALGHMRGPRLDGLRLDVSEASARRRAGNADEVLAAGALNLAAGMAGIALQRLVAVRTAELEFGGVHGLRPQHAQTGYKKDIGFLYILLELRGDGARTNLGRCAPHLRRVLASARGGAPGDLAGPAVSLSAPENFADRTETGDALSFGRLRLLQLPISIKHWACQDASSSSEPARADWPQPCCS